MPWKAPIQKASYGFASAKVAAAATLLPFFVGDIIKHAPFGAAYSDNSIKNTVLRPNWQYKASTAKMA